MPESKSEAENIFLKNHTVIPSHSIHSMGTFHFIPPMHTLSKYLDENPHPTPPARRHLPKQPSRPHRTVRIAPCISAQAKLLLGSCNTRSETSLINIPRTCFASPHLHALLFAGLSVRVLRKAFKHPVPRNLITNKMQRWLLCLSCPQNDKPTSQASQLLQVRLCILASPRSWQACRHSWLRGQIVGPRMV
jgi:hypothetical protein